MFDQKKEFIYYKTYTTERILYNELIVHYENNKPMFAYFEGTQYPYYDIAVDYDTMIKKLIKNKTQKKRLVEIKDYFLNLQNNTPKIGDIIYYYERKNKYKFIYDGNYYINDDFESISVIDILNYNIKFN
jgi:hypothetical protein